MVTASKYDIKEHMVENGFCEGHRMLEKGKQCWDIFFDGFPVLTIEITDGQFRVIGRLPREKEEWVDNDKS